MLGCRVARRYAPPPIAADQRPCADGSAFGGTGLCSCRVRGVDGSCAKHLTV